MRVDLWPCQNSRMVWWCFKRRGLASVALWIEKQIKSSVCHAIRAIMEIRGVDRGQIIHDPVKFPKIKEGRDERTVERDPIAILSLPSLSRNHYPHFSLSLFISLLKPFLFYDDEERRREPEKAKALRHNKPSRRRRRRRRRKRGRDWEKRKNVVANVRGWAFDVRYRRPGPATRGLCDRRTRWLCVGPELFLPSGLSLIVWSEMASSFLCVIWLDLIESGAWWMRVLIGSWIDSTMWIAFDRFPLSDLRSIRNCAFIALWPC